MRERKAVLNLGHLLVSSSTFFWGSILLISLGFSTRLIPETLFGLS